MDQVKGKWALITGALPDKSRIGIFSPSGFFLIPCESSSPPSPLRPSGLT
jgi:hypothetical protein